MADLTLRLDGRTHAAPAIYSDYIEHRLGKLPVTAVTNERGVGGYFTCAVSLCAASGRSMV